MSVCMSAVSARISEVLIKYTGKYVNIYFIMNITFWHFLVLKAGLVHIVNSIRMVSSFFDYSLEDAREFLCHYFIRQMNLARQHNTLDVLPL